MKHYKLLTTLLVATFFSFNYVWAEENAGEGIINFGSANGSTNINSASVTGSDSRSKTWTITTEGTTSFTPNADYAQIGSSKKPATSVTFTTTLSEEMSITAFSAKFGGFSGTAGSVTLKVDDAAVGEGSLNATNDVTVSSTQSATGKVLTVTVTGISKGVKCYNISYTCAESGSTPEPTNLNEQQFAWSSASATVTLNANNNVFPTLTNTQGLSVSYQSTEQTVATIGSTGEISILKAGTTTIKAIFAGNDSYNAKTVTYNLIVNEASDTPSGNEVTDELTQSWTGVTGTSYTDWTGKTSNSDAVYAGNSAGGNSSIQLRSNSNNSGIVTTASGGKAKRITVTWNSNTSSGRTIDVYGSNSEYNSAADLYNEQTRGGKLGSIVYSTSTTLDINQDCKYIGLRSSSGALYLDEISVVWDVTDISNKENVPEEKLKWSTSSATVTKDAGNNIFPILTNSLLLSISYESTNTEVATISNTGAVSIIDAGTTTIKAIFPGNDTYKAKTVTYELTVNPAAITPIEGGIVDVLNSEWSEITESNYKDLDKNAPTSTAHYVGNCAGNNNTIQLRSTNSTSGIVSSISAGKVKRVEVKWNSGTANDRTVNVYGSNTAYTSAGELYESNLTPIGTIVIGKSNFVNITDDYKYVGIRSASGAMYLDEIRITWLPTLSALEIDNNIKNGKVIVSGADNLSAVAEGTELTLTNEPTTGFKLSSYVVYKSDDPSKEIAIENGKFKMPGFAVTVSAIFEPLKTLTGIEITTPANQTTFWKGETFNYIGLVVTAHFEGADDAIVTPTVTGTTTSVGTQTVTVSYTEGVTKSVSYTINVRDIANTKETPFTIAEAIDIIDKLSNVSEVYVSGVVSSIATEYNEQYGNISFFLSADGTTGGAQVEAYRCKALNNTKFNSADELVIGATVVVYGNLTKFKETYELGEGCYLAAYEAPTTPKTDISNTKETAYTVSEALTLALDLNSDLTKAVYIKGLVYKTDNYNAQNGTYDIYVKDADKDNKFEFYKCEGIYNESQDEIITFEQGDIQIGDQVIGYGVMAYYANNDIWELKNGYLVEVNSRIDAGLAYETETVDKYVGDEAFVNPLTNPNSVSVTYASSDEEVATIAGNGQVTIKAEGTTTISATFAGDETYKPATISYTLNVAIPAAPFEGDYYVKVTKASELKSGEYLIVYEEGKLAFDGSLETLDAVGNTIAVPFDGNKIQGTSEVVAALFTIDVAAGTIQSASGQYIGQASDANGLAASAETAYTNTITLDEDGNANIVSGGAYLRYNAASNQTRFRYYKSSSYTGQKAIQLYKKETTEPVEPELNFEQARTGLAVNSFYTICMPKNILAIRGASFWSLSNRAADGSKVYFEEAVAPFEAGKPYIFYTSATILEVAYGDDEALTPGVNGALHGTFANMVQTDINEAYANNSNSPIYIIAQNKMWQVANNTGNSLGANRAYIVYNDLTTGEPASAPGRRVIAMPMKEDTATDINNLNVGTTDAKKVVVNGQFLIIREGKVYNATGCVVKE